MQLDFCTSPHPQGAPQTIESWGASGSVAAGDIQTLHAEHFSSLNVVFTRFFLASAPVATRSTSAIAVNATRSPGAISPSGCRRKRGLNPVV